jgi:HTH-type transcriptional regulator/antitoxin HigA
MATKTTFRLKGKSRDSYLELVLDFPLASIKSEKHLAEAQRVKDRLLGTRR